MSSSTKKLRACLLCSFVATPTEFRREGCPNCEEYLEMKGSSERVLECTTGQFDGAIAMISPEQSWVAKWQRNGARDVPSSLAAEELIPPSRAVDKHLPGVYAVRVSGSLPQEIVDDLEGRGFKVQSREMDD